MNVLEMIRANEYRMTNSYFDCNKNMIKLHYQLNMKLHGDNACKFHSFEKYDPKTDRNKDTMFWLYDEESYKLLANHQGRKYVYWHNNDEIALQKRLIQFIPVVHDPSIIHACHNYCLRDGLASLGIYSIIRPIFWGDPGKYNPVINLTKDCFITANKDREREYGEWVTNALAWAFPDWTFHIFGIVPTIPVYCDNVRYYGWIPEEEMDELTNHFRVCFRFNQHDGFSQTVMKARMRGQAAITSLYYDETNHYRTFDELMTYFKLPGTLNYKPVPASHFTNFNFIK